MLGTSLSEYIESKAPLRLSIRHALDSFRRRLVRLCLQLYLLVFVLLAVWHRLQTRK